MFLIIASIVYCYTLADGEVVFDLIDQNSNILSLLYVEIAFVTFANNSKSSKMTTKKHAKFILHQLWLNYKNVSSN